MSHSTNGEISFGILFPEGFEFPWESYGEEEWWLKTLGYKPPFELFNEEGNYINSLDKDNKEKISQYFAHKRDFETKNPLPFELVNYCSANCPMFILACPGSVKTAYRGYPKEISLSSESSYYSEKEALLNFIQTYLKDIDGFEDIDLTFKWYLSSYTD